MGSVDGNPHGELVVHHVRPEPHLVRIHQPVRQGLSATRRPEQQDGEGAEQLRQPIRNADRCGELAGRPGGTAVHEPDEVALELFGADVLERRRARRDELQRHTVHADVGEHALLDDAQGRERCDLVHAHCRTVAVVAAARQRQRVQSRSAAAAGAQLCRARVAQPVDEGGVQMVPRSAELDAANEGAEVDIDRVVGLDHVRRGGAVHRAQKVHSAEAFGGGDVGG